MLGTGPCLMGNKAVLSREMKATLCLCQILQKCPQNTQVCDNFHGWLATLQSGTTVGLELLSSPLRCSVYGALLAFYSVNSRGDSLKAQNARGAGGGCFIGGPRNLATAVVKGMCRCSSDTEVRFYSRQINFLMCLSIIYQHFTWHIL